MYLAPERSCREEAFDIDLQPDLPLLPGTQVHLSATIYEFLWVEGLDLIQRTTVLTVPPAQPTRVFGRFRPGVYATSHVHPQLEPARILRNDLVEPIVVLEAWANDKRWIESPCSLRRMPRLYIDEHTRLDLFVQVSPDPRPRPFKLLTKDGVGFETVTVALRADRIDVQRTLLFRRMMGTPV